MDLVCHGLWTENSLLALCVISAIRFEFREEAMYGNHFSVRSLTDLFQFERLFSLTKYGSAFVASLLARLKAAPLLPDGSWWTMTCITGAYEIGAANGGICSYNRTMLPTSQMWRPPAFLLSLRY